MSHKDEGERTCKGSFTIQKAMWSGVHRDKGAQVSFKEKPESERKVKLV